MKTQKWAGIDISKSELVVAIYPDGTQLKFANTQDGIKELASAMNRLSPELITMESSGSEVNAAAELSTSGLSVAVVNPKQVRDFARALGVLAKTDEIDAMVIARFGEAVKPETRPLRDKQEREVKTLLARRRQLVCMMSDEKNRLSHAEKIVHKEIESHIRWLEKRISDMDGKLDAAIKQSPVWKEKEDLLKSVKGVGQVLSKTLIIDLPELGRLNRKEIGALAGVAPINRDSGIWHGERGIYGGRKHVRRTLYICTIAAIQSNKQIRGFYERLIGGGKKPKVAIVACMRKLLVILNAMLRDKSRWRYEAEERRVEFCH